MSPRKEWDDVQNCLSPQERRMGHGKSRPLRNLSKKKGFRILNDDKYSQNVNGEKLQEIQRWQMCVWEFLLEKLVCGEFITFFTVPQFHVYEVSCTT